MTRISSDDELTKAAEAGDPAAIQQLLLPYCESLSRQIAAQLPTRIQTVVGVEDILQQTLIQAVQDLNRRTASDTASLHNWLHAIARHRVQDAVRRHDRVKRSRGRHQVAGRGDQADRRMVGLLEQLSDHGDSPSKQVAATEAVHAVQVGVATLPHDQRDAVSLRYFRGLSVEETAIEMDRTPGAVRGLVDRAKRSLRCALGNSSRWFSRK